MIIPAPEVKAYQFNDKLYCLDCAGKKNLKNLTRKNFITITEIGKINQDGNFVFCDGCGKEL